VPLPRSPVLTGLQCSLQAIAGPTASAVGADLTNAVLWTFGR
jgi:hypothetical protein